MENDVYLFGVDDKVTCPWCGTDCNISDDDNVADCPECKSVFNWEVDMEDDD